MLETSAMCHGETIDDQTISEVPPEFAGSHQNREALIEEMSKLLPELCDKLLQEACFEDFFNLMKLIGSGSFSTDNICFRLCMEVVRWYSCSNINAMWYSEETMKFWKSGYRLMKEKFVLFMAGRKGTGLIVSGSASRGNISPQSTEINFAVPSLSILRQYNADVFPPRLQPGLIRPTLESKASDREKDFILSVDGKKLAPGINESEGDIDLFGHEKGITLQKQKTIHQKEDAMIKEAQEMLEKLASGDSDESSKSSADSKLRDIHKMLSSQLQDSRNNLLKLERLMNKLLGMGDRYQFAVSSVKTQVHRTRLFQKSALEIISQICMTCSTLANDNNAVEKEEISISTQGNWFHLKEPEQLPDTLTDSHFIKQHSESWHELRSKHRVTGSTMHNAIGLRSLKDQKSHFDKVIMNKTTPLSSDAQARMAHGTDNEKNAIATLVAVVLPFLFPGTAYVEEGAYIIKPHQDKLPILVSPDGSIRFNTDPESMVSSPKLMAVEIKCPTPGENKLPVMYAVPTYYVCQLLCEMFALGVKRLLFMSYSFESTTVFEVEMDHELFCQCYELSDQLFGGEFPRRPSVTHPSTKLLRTKLNKFVEEHTRFLGEFPSKVLQAERIETLSTADLSPFMTASVSNRPNIDPPFDVCNEALFKLSSTVNEWHMLSRKKGFRGVGMVAAGYGQTVER
jgi:hypothetical protein